ncbi:uncharacterized protein EI90DRAFT_71372 [Cantharellus anzutake]|uniref:uncharacterized protein n=1 Tax=Cantharellus anzutake TaxID=1750568 RepID=UPI0019082C91|nr:uncharacterized protein EI90DRAFT_71372 [Cantharellus anzutake]KAF8344346.1 hypothetical protein EI90DRAFT_71372 [Cantharellus anzutake]
MQLQYHDWVVKFECFQSCRSITLKRSHPKHQRRMGKANTRISPGVLMLSGNTGWQMAVILGFPSIFVLSQDNHRIATGLVRDVPIYALVCSLSPWVVLASSTHRKIRSANLHQRGPIADSRFNLLLQPMKRMVDGP